MLSDPALIAQELKKHSKFSLPEFAQTNFFGEAQSGQAFDFKSAKNELHLEAVVVPVMELTTERRIVGGLMSSFRMLDSVARGKPLSSISSRSS